LHNNVMWDCQYYMEYSPHTLLTCGIFYIIFSIP
jgi:hypothetical protein